MKRLLIVILVCSFICCYGKSSKYLANGNSNQQLLKGLVTDFMEVLPDMIMNDDQEEDVRVIRPKNPSRKTQQATKIIKSKLVDDDDDQLYNGYISRKYLFPAKRIKQVKINANGSRIGYLIEDGTQRYIRIVSTQNLMAGKDMLYSTVSALTRSLKKNQDTTASYQVNIKEKHTIRDFEFWGDNVIYTSFDNKNHLQVKVYISPTSRKKMVYSNKLYDSSSLLLPLGADLKSVRFLKIKTDCLLEVFDGSQYTTYEVKSSNYSSIQRLVSDTPNQSLYNDNLSDIVDVLYIQGQNSKMFNHPNAGEVIIKQLGIRISEDDLNNVKYMLKKVRGKKNTEQYVLYKAFVENMTLYLQEYVQAKPHWNTVCEYRGITNLADCMFNMDANGDIAFITLNDKKYSHFTQYSNVKKSLERLNGKFQSWYRVDTSEDGLIWLICSVNDKQFNQYYIYDVEGNQISNITPEEFTVSTYLKNNKLNEIDATELQLINENKLKAMEYLATTTNSGQSIQMFFTKSNGNYKTDPIVVMLTSSGRYIWEYTPMVQLLSNRGYNVLCINCRAQDFDANITHATNEMSSDIVDALSWFQKQKGIKLKNIILLAKKHSIIPAMRVLKENPKIMAGIIAISPSKKDISTALTGMKINDMATPILFLGRFDESPVLSKLISSVNTVERNLKKKKGKVIGASRNNNSVVINRNSTTQKNLKHVPLSVISTTGWIPPSIVGGIVETFISKALDVDEIEPIYPGDLEQLYVMHDALDIIPSRGSFDDYDEDTLVLPNQSFRIISGDDYDDEDDDILIFDDDEDALVIPSRSVKRRVLQ